MKSIAALALLATLSPLPAFGVQTSLQLQISSDRDFQTSVLRYDCGAEEPITVTYINAAPNFLAVVPIAEETQPMVFTAVISGSGVRYAAGKWIWWTKGADAELYDETADDPEKSILTCAEINNTP